MIVFVSSCVWKNFESVSLKTPPYLVHFLLGFDTDTLTCQEWLAGVLKCCAALINFEENLARKLLQYLSVLYTSKY